MEELLQHIFYWPLVTTIDNTEISFNHMDE